MSTFYFVFKSCLLGAGLAMDAFSVSLANGLNESQMSTRKMCRIAGVFAFFQALMPMLGWFCVHTVLKLFSAFETMIPWIALLLLGYIGTKMIVDSVKNTNEADTVGVGFSALLVQGIATSIDALSVGFTIADHNVLEALVSSLIIAAVTFVICMVGVAMGKKAGASLAGKAGIFGGIILIVIGLEIFITNLI